MWRASLGKRLVLLVSALVLSLVWSFYRAGPTPEAGYELGQEETSDDELIRRNLLLQLRSRYGVDLGDNDIFFWNTRVKYFFYNRTEE